MKSIEELSPVEFAALLIGLLIILHVLWVPFAIWARGQGWVET